ncbi:hypothetical protein P152DRAFT_447854 [Eremomyces bilateralis CBS 781.70]|uniref:Uncharacterized protein n=1 Tax=Eremomyces bilateralis CBS 781.70 TaxID=1392243 RepID=A0A6G1G8X8_9PEZI|nr:uncharacterized protein P152DRAFT_447854 [Eremomyces bilateralis CBS 781.70]KAF1814504.1 hypothetical protein P152DRAFT_447854 [Eremomyces bilateralis CBS 781.70]
MSKAPSSEDTKTNVFEYARKWGENPLPPTVLATLITAQHARPLQKLPMVFAPLFLFTSYMNLGGYKTEAAGTSAAWSALYMLLASRRKQSIKSTFSVRGVVRGATMATCAVQVAGGALAYLT